MTGVRVVLALVVSSGGSHRPGSRSLPVVDTVLP
ncbi:hypothetical protein BKA19_0836 [Blastococcus saxobsidens]|uniref:Uncharacterized protein n=1 Tax=Blastococcus saxobsidens TaxID=138336 RepID=A0A4Q7Y5I6_9ACTN|nr:hypothetical protein BKA19_0836 [Blastococcus saxobsidens]